jgi:hypothetical protein
MPDAAVPDAEGIADWVPESPSSIAAGQKLFLRAPGVDSCKAPNIGALKITRAAMGSSDIVRTVETIAIGAAGAFPSLADDVT